MRHRAPARNRDRFRIVCVLAGLTLAGCSAGQGERGAALHGVAVEPELRPVAVVSQPASRQRRFVRPIPVVITPPRPFRLAAAIAARSSAAPQVRPSPLAPMAVRLASAEADATPRPLPAGERAPHEPAAAAEIRGMFAAYLGAFNRHDPAALAAHWSPSGENVDLDSGEVTSGRDAVRRVFSALFVEDGAATIDIDLESIRPLRPDVALVDGVSRIAFDDGASAGSRFAAVVVRHEEGWLLESVREAAGPGPASAGKPLDALAWLVGSWEDEGEGVTASTRCFWSTGRAFLVRTHAVAPDRVPGAGAGAGDDRIPGLLPATDVRSRELTEIIGWDPRTRTVRSWLFTSDGQFAEGTWTREGDAWTIRFEGRGADAEQDCSCTILRTGPDSLSVRGSGGPLVAILPPACDFTRTAR